MTWAQWMAARRLLYEEQIGTHLRASDNAKSTAYQKSVAMLKRYSQE